MNDIEQKMRKLYTLKNSVRSLVRIHGVPLGTDVVLKNIPDGICGYADKKKLLIGLSSHVYDTCSKSAVKDVYYGIGLHEASHLNHTVNLYEHLRTCKLNMMRILLNFLEDERIEDKIKKESPGFYEYIETMKVELFDNGEFGISMLEWGDLDDFEKSVTIFGPAIRRPELLPKEAKDWKTGKDVWVYGRIKKILGKMPPPNEVEVHKKAKSLYKLYKKILREYGKEREEKIDDDRLTRILADFDGAGRKALENLKKSRELKHTLLDAAIEQVEMMTPLDADEKKELQKYDEQRLTIRDEWVHSGIKRENIVIHSVVNSSVAAKYEKHKRIVENKINKMKDIFRFRLGKKTFVSTELKEGRLHRRRLGLALINDRIFTTKYVEKSTGISLCLLLDESGSMMGRKIETAVEVAILIAEALKDVPGVELEIYSFTSCGDLGKDNRMKYLYGKNNSNIKGIGDYEADNDNYDHMALKTAGAMFLENTTNDLRIMIVMSDGFPAGYYYGGNEADKLARNEVLALEKKGIHVLCVAIESYNVEKIYKHYFKFVDHNTLVNDMGKLLKNIIRENT